MAKARVTAAAPEKGAAKGRGGKAKAKATAAAKTSKS